MVMINDRHYESVDDYLRTFPGMTCIECHAVFENVHSRRWVIHDFELVGPLCNKCLDKMAIPLGDCSW